MTEPPPGMRSELREVFVPVNAVLSKSQKHDGYYSALARDRDTRDLSHAVIGDRVEEPGPTTSEVVPFDDWHGEVDSSQEIPTGLVALASGVVVGAAGVFIVRKLKQKKAEKRLPSPPPELSPAGWHVDVTDPSRLRFWDGAAWTDHYAHRAPPSPAVPSGWYADPDNSAQLRYWDGRAWTQNFTPHPAATPTSAPGGWYLDPYNADALRYWDGAAWTHHVTGRHELAIAPQPFTPATEFSSPATMGRDRISMSTAEWQAHVRAWLQAGMVQQDLWERLSRADIHDGDESTLGMQRKMGALTPHEGAERATYMLEANPAWRDQQPLVDFLTTFDPQLHVRATPRLHRG